MYSWMIKQEEDTMKQFDQCLIAVRNIAWAAATNCQNDSANNMVAKTLLTQCQLALENTEESATILSSAVELGVMNIAQSK